MANRYRNGFSKPKRTAMKIAIYAAATALCLVGLPGVIGTASAVSAVDRPPITLAQYGERDHWRDRDRPFWRHRHEGCREVTVRERRGGEMIVKHIRRCD
jgi:hypothetical protein